VQNVVIAGSSEGFLHGVSKKQPTFDLL